MAENPKPANGLEGVLDALVASYTSRDCALNNLETAALPNRRAVIEAFNHLLHVLYLGFFSTRRLSRETLRLALAEHLLPAAEILCAQVERAAAWEIRQGREPLRGHGEVELEGWCKIQVMALLRELPALRDVLGEDVRAAFHNDPAAESMEDVVFSYPTVFAVTAYRLAHILYQRHVPMIPRILTEHAHTRTGIDIHPGARIGRRFFIDHGTGVVIGATTVIGDDVKIYQGVTLGALSVRGDVERDRKKVEKRHPTLEDGVTVYAGSTILGGDTVVGAGSVIGGNVWLIESVPPGSRVFYRSESEQP